MRKLLVRLWRWFTNPCPQPRQVWVVEGIGRVLIKEVSSKMNKVVFYHGDDSFTWELHHFKRQATLVEVL